jgi:hypothetical protein
MAEGTGTPEIAHGILHRHEEKPDEKDEKRDWHDEAIEIVEAILLAIVAVATAWSGYQASVWDSHQAKLYGISSRQRALATQSSTLAGQYELYDTNVFSFWLEATAAHDPKTAALFERRFRPPFKVAFAAWLETDPFHNPNAPAGPLQMPQYKNPTFSKAAAQNAAASAAFEEGTAAREDGDKYVRNTVLLATVLFLVALAQRFKFKAVRLSLLGASAVLVVIGLYFVLSYPVA